MQAQNTSHRLYDALCEFIEAGVHTALQARGVYPSEVFQRQRLYGIQVCKPRHPAIYNYVGSVLAQAQHLLELHCLQEVILLFQDTQGLAVSKLVFILQGIQRSPTVTPDQVDQLEAAWASTLLKLQFIDNLAPPLPPGSTFELLLLSSERPPPGVLVEEDLALLQLGAAPGTAAVAAAPSAHKPAASTPPSPAAGGSAAAGAAAGSSRATPPTPATTAAASGLLFEAASAGAAAEVASGSAAGVGAPEGWAVGIPVHGVHVPQCLSMQVLLEVLEPVG